MVVLRLSVKICSVENLNDYTAFLVVLYNPENITLQKLASIITQKWKKLHPDTDALHIKELLDDNHDTDKLDVDLTVADVFVDIGKAATNGFDQRATVRVVQQSTTQSRSSVSSFIKSTSQNSHASTQNSRADARSEPPLEARGSKRRKTDRKSGSSRMGLGSAASSRGDDHQGKLREQSDKERVEACQPAELVEANRLIQRFKAEKPTREQRAIVKGLSAEMDMIESADDAERQDGIIRIGRAVHRLKTTS